MELFQASNQWANRPDDERFWNIPEMLEAAETLKKSARTGTAISNTLQVTPDGDQLTLAGPAGNAARLTNWSFGQVARYAGAPASYLRTLPAERAADNINWGLANLDPKDVKILFHKAEGGFIRSVNGETYSRIWNADVLKRIAPLTSQGWKTPPAMAGDSPRSREATEEDCLKTSLIRPGDMIQPSGLYLSDHDMFAFLVNENRIIDDGSDGGLARGFFVENSEVGDGALKMTTFLYRYVCGNHIVWGAEEVNQIRIVHRGDSAHERYRDGLAAQLDAIADIAASEDEARIAAAKRLILGKGKEEVVKTLFGRRIASKKLLEECYVEACRQEAETNAGSPDTAWGFVQGMTAYSQQFGFADKRTEIDQAAGKVLELAS